ncbi:hypothetical protein [Gymnodinialimonas sp.]
MSRRDEDACCGRKLDPKEILVADAGLDRDEVAILTLTRFYFQSFAVPQTHAWIGALEHTQAHFGEAHGLLVAGRVLGAIKVMRSTRRSVFCFNSPTCPGCAAILTEHERRMIRSLAALRCGRDGLARTELMMLCEGNDTDDVLAAFRVLAQALPYVANRAEGANVYHSVH